MSKTWYIVIGVALFLALPIALPLFKRMWDRWKEKTSISEESWKSYMSVQWVFLIVSLGLGYGLAWGAVRFGPIRSERPQTGGVLMEPRRIELTEQRPVYTSHLSLENSSRVTVLTRTVPRRDSEGKETGESGAATVTIQRSNEGRGEEIRRINSVGQSWSRWEEDNPKGEMGVIVEPASGVGAAQLPVVELIIYTTPKK